MISWRDRAAPVIARVIADVGRDDLHALRRALRDAYPFGPRKYWPYKVWCQEVRRQLGYVSPRVRAVTAREDTMTGDLFA